MGSLTIPPGGQITNLTQGGPTRPPVGSQGPMPMTLGNATQGAGGGMRSGGLSTFQTPLPSMPGMSNMTPPGKHTGCLQVSGVSGSRCLDHGLEP